MTTLNDQSSDQINETSPVNGKPPSGSAFQQNPTYPKPTVQEATADSLDPTTVSSAIHVIIDVTLMELGNVVNLTFNGNDTFTPITITAGKNTITFEVPVTEVTRAIGKKVDVLYGVTRPDSSLLSETLELDVLTIPLDKMPLPEITQAVAGELNVSSLTRDADLTVAPWPLIATGQRLWMELQGFDQDNVPHDLNLPAWQGYTIDSIGAQTTQIPLSYLVTLGWGTELKLVLSIAFDGGEPQQTFGLKTYRIASAAVTLPLPVVVEADGEKLLPMKVTGGATVEIIYPDMQMNDIIALFWNGKADAAPWEQVEIPGTVTLTVPPSEIAIAFGKTIDVQYAVQRYGVWSLPSLILKLTVLPLMEEDFEMPTIKEASAGTLGVLDLNTFQGDAHIEIPPWPFIEADIQRVWLDMKWTTEIVRIIPDHVVTPEEAESGVISVIARTELERILEGAEIEFAPQVLFDKNADPKDAFSISKLKLHIWQGYGIEDFQSYAVGEINSPTFQAKNTLFTFSTEELQHNAISGTSDNKALSFYCNLRYSTKATLNPDRRFNYIAFDANIGQGSSPVTVTCYNDADDISIIISSKSPRRFEFNLSEMKYLLFTGMDTNGYSSGFTIDNVELK